MNSNSSYLSSVPLKFLFDLVPQFDALDRIAFGTYGEDQTMMNALFPGHINRIIATLDRDERRSQFASATPTGAALFILHFKINNNNGNNGETTSN